MVKDMNAQKSTQSLDTPMIANAFKKPDEEKIKVIEKHFSIIMTELGLDINDESLKDTPHNVSKMFVKEMFSGLNPLNKPKITFLTNSYDYDEIIVEANITFNSTCQYHFLPIIGKIDIGYVSSGRVVSISKLNKIIQFYARRPQTQERLVLQIFNELKTILDTENIIVVLETSNLCSSFVDIKDPSNYTSTFKQSGSFEQKEFREDFFRLINHI